MSSFQEGICIMSEKTSSRRPGIRVCVLALSVVLFVSALSAAQLSGSARLAFAATQAEVSAPDSVILNMEQSEFSIPISIAHPEQFAAVELAVQCGEGVEVSAVDYGLSASQAGPTFARGLTWFSIFAGSNVFAGEITANVQLRYSGSDNTTLVIDHAAFHSKIGNAFATENLALRQTVTINRQGADNPPAVLEPPDPNVEPGTGNPPSGALDTYAPPTNALGSDSTSGNVSALAPSDAATETEDTAAPPSSDAATTSIPSAEVPLNDPGSANNIPSDDNPMNGALLAFAIICLASTVVLGLLLIAAKRRGQNQHSKP